MKSKYRLWLFVIVPMFFLFPSFIEAQDNQGSVPTSDTFGNFINFKLNDPQSLTSSLIFSSSLINQEPFQWSSFYGQKAYGPHSFQIFGGLTSRIEPLTIGDPISAGTLQASVMYRYHGLFGGIVRPVTRFTVGIGQYWRPIGGISSFHGYSAGLSTYAMPEAGVEIVYKGVGVGMTVAYPFAIEDYFPGKDLTGYPFPPRSHKKNLNFDQLFKNIYLILE